MAREFRQSVQGSVDEAPEQLASAASAGDERRRPGKRPFRPQQMNRQDGRFGPIRNKGETVERKSLTPWEAYAQALLFSNELAYVN
jgi:hypothetical protein